MYTIGFSLIYLTVFGTLLDNNDSYIMYAIFHMFIRYAKAYRNYADFLYRPRLLTIRLLEQRYVAIRLKSSLQKCYGRHHELVGRYGISICTMNVS